MSHPAKCLALAFAVVLSGCARDADDLARAARQVEYSAVGQEPGWALRIDAEQIRYTGDGGETYLTVARPITTTTATGQRYATARIAVDIIPNACNDTIAGSGFPDRVVVSANGQQRTGCGGARLPRPDILG